MRRLAVLAMLVTLRFLISGPALARAEALSWCPDSPGFPPVRATPTPPGFTDWKWAEYVKRCADPGAPPTPPNDWDAVMAEKHACAYACVLARARLQAQQHPSPPLSSPLPPSGPQQQGPFPLPGGGKGYVLPANPDPTPTLQNGGGDPPGAFNQFEGADLNATNDSQPPDVAADVSPGEEAEFVNSRGLFVYSKPVSSSQTPTLLNAPTSLSNFWCGTRAVNGVFLPGCDLQGGGLLPGFALTDTQIGWDSSMGRWVATTVSRVQSGLSPTNPDSLYFAVSANDKAEGSWLLWSVSLCLRNSSGDSPPYLNADQPLLGWSNQSVAVDVLCFNGSQGALGQDDLIVIPESDLVPVPSMVLPNPIKTPVSGMTPVRDVLGLYPTLYVAQSVVPRQQL